MKLIFSYKWCFISLIFFYAEISKGIIIHPIVNRVSIKYQWVEVKIQRGDDLELGEVLTANIDGNFICDLVVYKQKDFQYYFADSKGCPYLQYLKKGLQLKRFQFLTKRDYKKILLQRKMRLSNRKKINKINKINKKKKEKRKKIFKKDRINNDLLFLSYHPKDGESLFQGRGYFGRGSHREQFEETGGVREQKFKNTASNVSFGLKRGIGPFLSFGVKVEVLLDGKNTQQSDFLGNSSLALQGEEKNRGLKLMTGEAVIRLMARKKNKSFLDLAMAFAPKLGTAKRANNHAKGSGDGRGTTRGNAYLGQNIVTTELRFFTRGGSGLEWGLFSGLILEGKKEVYLLNSGQSDTGQVLDRKETTGAKFNFFAHFSLQFEMKKNIFLKITPGLKVITQEKVKSFTYSSDDLITLSGERDGYQEYFIESLLKVNMAQKYFLIFGAGIKFINNYEVKLSEKSREESLNISTTTMIFHSYEWNLFTGVGLSF